MFARWWRHLTTTPVALRRAFPAITLAAINDAIAASEGVHRAEIRVAVETAFSVRQLWQGLTPRERAVEVFSTLRVWDTAGNNGVLLYVLLAEQDIEIVADRAFAARVPEAALAAICRRLAADFANRDYRDGMLRAVEQLGALAAPHFPADGVNPDELPNSPVLL